MGPGIPTEGGPEGRLEPQVGVEGEGWCKGQAERSWATYGESLESGWEQGWVFSVQQGL